MDGNFGEFKMDFLETLRLVLEIACKMTKDDVLFGLWDGS